MANNKLSKIFTLLAVSLTATNAYATPFNENYFRLEKAEVVKVDQLHAMSADELKTFAYNGNCSGSEDQPGTSLPKNPPSVLPNPNPSLPIIPGPTIPQPIVPGLPPVGATNTGGITSSLNNIINIGKMIWSIIKENQPVSNVQTERAYAMPQGIKCWTELENWARPTSETYEVSYKNYYGSKVVRFKTKLIYYYGGAVKGKGKFLANVTLVPTDVHVSWGFKLNAVVKTDHPINLASSEDPVAGLGISVQWQVGSMVTDKIQTMDLFVDGLGNVDKL